MKKIRALIIFVLFVLCCFVCFACGNSDIPNIPNVENSVVTYYNYDITSGEFDKDDKIIVSGGKVEMYLAFDENAVLSPVGEITFDGEDFSATASTKYMGLEIECIFRGFKLNDALVLTYKQMNIGGLSTGSSTDREYYCREGKTDLSRTVVLDLAGGTVDGRSFVTLKTDNNGRLTSDIPSPVRDKYDFYGYKFPDGRYLGAYENYVDRNVTLTAEWKRYYLVRYDVGSTDGKIDESVSVGKLFPSYEGEIMTIPAPPMLAYTGEPASPFRGWFVNGVPYNSGMETSDDVTVKGEWYDKATVDNYNASLSSYGSNCLVVHVKPNFHSEWYEGRDVSEYEYDNIGNYCSFKLVLSIVSSITDNSYAKDEEKASEVSFTMTKIDHTGAVFVIDLSKTYTCDRNSSKSISFAGKDIKFAVVDKYTVYPYKNSVDAFDHYLPLCYFDYRLTAANARRHIFYSDYMRNVVPPSTWIY